VFVRFSRVAGKSRSARIMIYRAPLVMVVWEPPGGSATTSPPPWRHTGFPFCFIKARGLALASLRPLERRESITPIARRLVGDISLIFAACSSSKRSGAVSIYTTCCARYPARRAAGPPTGCYINRISRARETQLNFGE